MNWISVKEKLPNKLEKVLFCCEQDLGYTKKIYVGYLSEKGWDIYLPYSSFKLNTYTSPVTHWMELPELPGENE